MSVKSEKPRPQEKANPAGFRKVSFGAIAKQKSDSRTTYPLLPDPQGRYAAIAVRILERSVQVEALAGALEVDKADLKTLATLDLADSVASRGLRHFSTPHTHDRFPASASADVMAATQRTQDAITRGPKGN